MTQNELLNDFTLLLFQECETSFRSCAHVEKSSNNMSNVQAFRACINPIQFPNLAGCTLDCAPTYNMLRVSEEPALARFDIFGPGMETPSPRPENSLCQV